MTGTVPTRKARTASRPTAERTHLRLTSGWRVDEVLRCFASLGVVYVPPTWHTAMSMTPLDISVPATRTERDHPQAKSNA